MLAAGKTEAEVFQKLEISADRAMVHVHRGKGAKDRYVPLPTWTLHWLRDYSATHRHTSLLFPAEANDHRKSPLATTTSDDSLSKCEELQCDLPLVVY